MRENELATIVVDVVGRLSIGAAHQLQYRADQARHLACRERPSERILCALAPLREVSR